MPEFRKYVCSVKNRKNLDVYIKESMDCMEADTEPELDAFARDIATVLRNELTDANQLCQEYTSP